MNCLKRERIEQKSDGGRRAETVLKIGNVLLENPLILAPMAGVTDLPFRLLCKEQGAGLVCMEMVSAKAIYYQNKNTQELLEIHPDEGPVSLQLFGSDPYIISQMAKQIEHRPFDILDLNMGCPVPKVVNNGEGSALMKNPRLAEEIITQTVKAVKKPVTVKIRKGFSEQETNAVEIAKIAEASGAAAVAVHGRTREQYYSGQADWDIIRQVKEAVSIPVIGNGDVTDGPSAKAMLMETGCDGIMIGRAAQGNPGSSDQEGGGEEQNCPGKGNFVKSPCEVRDVILRHAHMERELKGEYTAVREMRKHIAWYTAGYPNSAAFRRQINEIESFDGLKAAVEAIFSE